MKPQKIGIIYLNNFIENIAYAEFAYVTVVNKLVKQGREIESSTKTFIRFKDGTTVTKIPFSNVDRLKGVRLTHLYVDSSIMNIDDGRFFNTVLKPMVVKEGNYTNVDVEGSRNDRIIIFNKEEMKSINDN